MSVSIYIVKLKNYLKITLNDNSRVYRWLQDFYKKFIFPVEQSAWKKKKGNGFKSGTALYMCSLMPKKTLDLIIKYYQPATWLDIGCGIGASLKYVRKHGIKILGIENSALAIKISKLNKSVKQHDLTRTLNLVRQFDIVWCYEVAEHLPVETVDIFIETLVCHGNHIILSAARPGQGGEGHINEQPPSYWIKKMNDNGFIVDEEITQKIHALNELYSANVYCFKKNTCDLNC